MPNLQTLDQEGEGIKEKMEKAYYKTRKRAETTEK